MSLSMGERIRIIRKSNSLNQVEFSNFIGVSQGTLSELEQDKYKPSIDAILAIKDRFNTDIEWLIFGNKNTENKGIFNLAIEGQELDLISLFRELTKNDKDEIVEFIKLKISRY
ncbi:helix-turn-helix transcriptional regulator [Paenibacillus agricola]|uniref:Helix-turn-helix transcriptional regulator n=1 Tax=Paenibacillus agricola TaxID=2716264 RepID=A0ABX0JKC2_9BACL|nr:helix-turn-helix transcriptional regulator [Paenibacillus agricola]NHN35323.1 helix-turn-helix transcriptional regulator [Paenibacillus agricola]